LVSRDGRCRRKGKPAQRETEDKATQRRMDYDRFRQAAADRLFSSLPAKERAAIEAATDTIDYVATDNNGLTATSKHYIETVWGRGYVMREQGEPEARISA
jgi:hypothetical protein